MLGRLKRSSGALITGRSRFWTLRGNRSADGGWNRGVFSGHGLTPMNADTTSIKRLILSANLLLVFVPVAWILEYLVHARPLFIFVASALAIIPLAGIMGKATELLSARL